MTGAPRRPGTTAERANYRWRTAMKFAKPVAAAIALGMLAWGCASQVVTEKDITPLQIRSTPIGMVITDPTGMTLYTYNDDPVGESECYGRCARKWVPVTAKTDQPDSGVLTVIERRDGTRQYALRGKPLYTWAQDKKPGDVTGHKKGDVWFAAKP